MTMHMWHHCQRAAPDHVTRPQPRLLLPQPRRQPAGLSGRLAPSCWGCCKGAGAAAPGAQAALPAPGWAGGQGAKPGRHGSARRDKRSHTLHTAHGQRPSEQRILQFHPRRASPPSKHGGLVGQQDEGDRQEDTAADGGRGSRVACRPALASGERNRAQRSFRCRRMRDPRTRRSGRPASSRSAPGLGGPPSIAREVAGPCNARRCHQGPVQRAPDDPTRRRSRR